MFGQGVEKRIGTSESGVDDDFPKFEVNKFSGFLNESMNQRKVIKKKHV